MAILTRNLDNETFNPSIDNYMDLKVINLENTEFNDLQALTDLIDNCHSETIVIDADSDSASIVSFFADIEKLTILNEKKHAIGSYLTVRKIGELNSDWLSAIELN
jgi:hypothetical protein